jgi:hypothetical protein
MARAAQQQGKSIYDQGMGLSNVASGVAGVAGANAAADRSTLSPILTQEATNPQGYGASALAGMNTAVGQSTGGATAAAKGEGMLDAARTGNRGGFQSALADSAREGENINANAALGIQGKNEDLKQTQKQMGIAGLGNLYSQDSGDQLKAMGLASQDLGVADQGVNTEINAGNSGWYQNLMGGVNTLANASKAVCWIAETIWGIDDRRTHIVRAWLICEFSNCMVGKILIYAYSKFGERLAAHIEQSRILKSIFIPIFNRALENAEEWMKRV